MQISIKIEFIRNYRGKSNSRSLISLAKATGSLLIFRSLKGTAMK